MRAHRLPDVKCDESIFSVAGIPAGECRGVSLRKTPEDTGAVHYTYSENALADQLASDVAVRVQFQGVSRSLSISDQAMLACSVLSACTRNERGSSDG